MGIRGAWFVGLPRVGLIGIEPTFVVLEIEQEYDGPEERAVPRNANCESIGGIRAVFRPDLKDRSRPPIRWAVSEIGAHARARDPPS